VTSASNDDASLDTLEEHFRSVLGPAWARDLRLVSIITLSYRQNIRLTISPIKMYEGIRTNGFGPSDEEYSDEVSFLGREPRSYEDYALSLMAEWKQEA
jgi:hypothetical protein